MFNAWVRFCCKSSVHRYISLLLFMIVDGSGVDSQFKVTSLFKGFFGSMFLCSSLVLDFMSFEYSYIIALSVVFIAYVK